jgi:hypothetical protein
VPEAKRVVIEIGRIHLDKDAEPAAERLHIHPADAARVVDVPVLGPMPDVGNPITAHP